jgi:2-polyprenyl-6-hydroxyphenyl methylase/3-demethylubiquinone-9 3-methyltransferase
MIKIMQDWKGTAFLAPDIHAWDMFIKPDELRKALKANHLINREIKGLAPGMNFIAHYVNLRKRARGELSWQELGRRLKLSINNNLSCTYIGYAKKVTTKTNGRG